MTSASRAQVLSSYPDSAAPVLAEADGAIFNFAEYWRLALKHRLLIIGALVAALAVGLAATLFMTPRYVAMASLQIDREAARIFGSDDVRSQESLIQGEEFFQTQYGLLRSRSLAERVIDSLGLANSDVFLEQMGLSAPKKVGTAADQSRARRLAVLAAIEDNLDVNPVRGSRLVVVSFESPDAVLAARVANAFAENFIQANLDRKYESSSYAREFLEDRIAQTKSRLEEAERQLVAYAANQQIINVREGDADSENTQSLAANDLVAMNAALADARAARISAEEKWRQASSAPANSLTEVLQNPAVQRLTEERAKVEAEYEQKLRIYQPEWPEVQQLRARLDELNRQTAALSQQIRQSIQNEYTVARNQEQALARRVAAAKSDVLNTRNRSIQYNILQRELDTSRTLYDGLLQRYKEVGVTGGIAANNISIVDTAAVPERPAKPNLLINLALAALIGLGLGVTAAFIFEALDENLGTPDDVESKLGLPVLGVIPLITGSSDAVSTLDDPKSPFSEAYASLRTALQFSTPQGAPRSMMLTSTRPAEGKSTTAYAVAVSLARVGRRVLLVDGDLRNPSMHRIVGVDNHKGMSNLLSHALSLDDVVQPSDVAGMSFVPCGPIPPNPAELWAGDGLRDLLAKAEETYDHVIIDGPPVLGFADAPMLASRVGGVAFVVESRGTRRAQARGALKRLLIGNCHLLGVVLTKFNTKTLQYGGYDYAYDYSYGDRQSQPGKPKGRA